MSLGDKSHLSSGQKDIYSRVGASHILALSGLHLMILYSLITLLMGGHRRLVATQLVVVMAVWSFAFLTGLSPSVTRSAFMISLYALLTIGCRDRMSVNTLALIAIVLLAVHPYGIYDMGFQLSFLAVLAILLVNPLLYQLIPLHILQRHRLLRALWGLVTVSIAAQVGTAPLVVYYFGRFSTYFLLSNFVVVPLAYLILALVLASLLVCWWPWAVALVASALSWFVGTMSRLLDHIAQLPFSSIEDIRLSTLQVCLVYLIFACCYILVSLRYPAVRRSG